MDGKQKRAAPSSSTASSGPPKKAARPSSPADESSWCTQCWKHPGDECTGGKHRLLPLEDARSMSRKALGDAHLALKSLQERHNTIEAAGEPTVLKLSIPAGAGEDYLYLDGGSMILRMAVTGALSEEEKKNVIKAMKNHSMIFELDSWALEDRYSEETEVAARGHLDRTCMAAVLEKLPLCVVGQKLPIGTILYYPDQWCNYEVYDKPFYINKRHVQRKVRLFGRVTNDFDLRADRDLGYIGNHPRGYKPSEAPIEITIKDVQFVDRSQMEAPTTRIERDW